MKFSMIFVIFTFLFASALCQNSYGNFVNTNVNRNIDLTSQLAKHTVTLTIQNNDNSAASSFYLTIPNNLASKLSLLEVTDVAGHQLKVSSEQKGERTLESGKKSNFGVYQVDFNKPLESKGSADLIIRSVFTHALTPYPASIAQTEKQLVRYNDNHYFYSPYTTTTQTTTVKLASGNLESKTDKAPTSIKGDTITYGSYADIAAYTVSAMNLHFENNKPFLTVTKLTKELEVSHWGNLAVEVTYDVLRDDGATLKGTFSRYDYQRNPAGSPAVVPVLRSILPVGAEDIYYRDEIGNISSSTINVDRRGLVLDMVPRFPLFGGWKTAFYMGYNLPLHNYLFKDVNDGSKYVLNTTFAVSTDDIVVDELVVRVILPEGSTNIEVHAPFGIDSKSFATHLTYLDTAGRPVLIVTKKNVVPDHDKHFQVTYNFSSSSMFREPFLLVGAFFTLLASIMLYVRINLRIGPAKVRSPNADRLEDLLLQFRDFIDQRTELHNGLDLAIAKLWKDKNEATYNLEKKRVEQGFAKIKNEMVRLIAQAEEIEIETGKRMREVEKKQERKIQNQEQLLLNEINYRLNKKIAKPLYEELKAEYEKYYKIVEEEIESFVSDLTEHL